MLIGYVRNAPVDRKGLSQAEVMRAAGCERIFEDDADSSELMAALDCLRAGDVLMVWRLGCLAGSFAQVLEVVETLKRRDISLRILAGGAGDEGSSDLTLSAVVAVSRAVIRQSQQAERKKPCRPRRVFLDEHIARAEAMLADPKVSVKEVAERFGVTAQTVRRHVPAARRRGAPVALNPADIEEARALLAVPGAQVTEVARRFGVNLATLRKRLPASRKRGDLYALSEQDVERAVAMLADGRTSMTKIADQLGVASSTLYRYLPAEPRPRPKPRARRLLSDEGLREVRALLADPTVKPGDVARRFGVAIRTLRKYVPESRNPRKASLSDQVVGRALAMLADGRLSIKEVAGRLGVKYERLLSRVPAEKRPGRTRPKRPLSDAGTAEARALLAETGASAADVARQLGVTKETLCRQVPESGGRNRRRLLSPTEIEQAKAMLAEPRATLKEVAARLEVSRKALSRHIAAADKPGRPGSLKAEDVEQARAMLADPTIAVAEVARRFGVTRKALSGLRCIRQHS